MRSFALALAAAGTVAALVLPSAAVAADVGVSVQISQPGVYGRVDIGRFPQPQVVVQQPVLVQRPYRAAPVQPVYMWVPPVQRTNWRRYCGQYGACGVPVYFVRDDWYGQHVRPARFDRDWRDDRRDDRRDWRQDRREDRRDDRREDRRDDRGPGGH